MEKGNYYELTKRAAPTWFPSLGAALEYAHKHDLKIIRVHDSL
jgi:hypothetical protein